jgi:ATP-dependent Clp protease ATP-binding subunit ClpC
MRVLTDAKGRKVDFSNTIIIMTGNVGAEKLQKEVSLGFSAQSKTDETELAHLHEKNKQSVTDALKKFMRPELINRIDKILVFRALSRAVIRDIVDIQLDDLRRRLQKQKLGLVADAKVKDYLLDKGYDQKNGVRPLRRLIQDDIEDIIAEGILSETYVSGDVIKLAVKKGALAFTAITE